MAAYRAALRGDATPNTPSTASSCVRQNPLTYQRMHSNDSDKEKDSGRASDWLDATPVANSNGALSKPNSSPNSKPKWITTTLPSGGRMNKPINLRPIQSMDEDQDLVDGNDAHLTMGVSDNTDNSSQPTIVIDCEKNRTETVNDHVDSEESSSNSSSIGSTTSLNHAMNSEPSPSESNSMQNQDDTKSNSTSSSAQYSMTDNSEKSDSKRNLLNKYVKKVKSPWKSLMKKWKQRNKWNCLKLILDSTQIAQTLTCSHQYILFAEKIDNCAKNGKKKNK